MILRLKNSKYIFINKKLKEINENKIKINLLMTLDEFPSYYFVT